VPPIPITRETHDLPIRSVDRKRNCTGETALGVTADRPCRRRGGGRAATEKVPCWCLWSFWMRELWQGLWIERALVLGRCLRRRSNPNRKCESNDPAVQDAFCHCYDLAEVARQPRRNIAQRIEAQQSPPRYCTQVQIFVAEWRKAAANWGWLIPFLLTSTFYKPACGSQPVRRRPRILIVRFRSRAFSSP
jgi:hypothetical protein